MLFLSNLTILHISVLLLPVDIPRKSSFWMERDLRNTMVELKSFHHVTGKVETGRKEIRGLWEIPEWMWQFGESNSVNIAYPCDMHSYDVLHLKIFLVFWMVIFYSHTNLEKLSTKVHICSTENVSNFAGQCQSR